MSVAEAILEDEKYLQAEFAKLTPVEQAVINWQMTWLKVQALTHQIEPEGDWWNIWLLLAGRGAGKTRAAAETLGWWAWEQAGTRWLVSSPTSGD